MGITTTEAQTGRADRGGRACRPGRPPSARKGPFSGSVARPLDGSASRPAGRPVTRPLARSVTRQSIPPAAGPVTRPVAGSALAVRPARRIDRVRATGDAGLATAEYAVATVAAVGFAGLLIAVLKSGTVSELLMGIVRGALSVG
ncbi:hypothetical protein GCM10025865_07980 [Paraoerskovia sediminicola]|uniref:DUF4244 domain-containing protein n=1 Tax=Paraoerskovia sediminicola TaxID=1138587 RepID=A0ABM8G0B8_9CELL|nr:DUF4244 domain-containing protein [Paraoerskovia sediminicola]BDZ41499.1 hypothetical protein GCM10025865_07980 [Paraoerskovia sediminicola]